VTTTGHLPGAARGFSLVEAMVAGAILAIALTAAAGSLSMGFRFIAERRLKATAEMVAQSHMEMLLAVERERNLQASDCAPVPYTREVIGDDDAAFVATCTIVANRPVTPTAAYDRLVVDVVAAFEGRDIKASYATYVVHR
jgi:type II secretory pathway pseudopilin PulG